MTTTYKQILFIEDEVDIAEVYARALQHNGFEVTCRYDGETGLLEAQTKPYDLILLDLMLPNKSGMDILKMLRNPQLSPEFDQKTDIIILTNFEQNDFVRKELLSMAKAYLLKVNITPLSLATYLKELESSPDAIPNSDYNPNSALL
jgi:DNA-binding response OmpR family regulator